MTPELHALLTELADFLDEQADAFLRHNEMTRAMDCKSRARRVRLAVAGDQVLPYSST